MAICDDIMDLLKDVSDRLSKLEEKVAALSINELSSDIVTIKQSNLTGLLINTNSVVVNSEVETLQIDAKGKVDVNGESKEIVKNTQEASTPRFSWPWQKD